MCLDQLSITELVQAKGQLEQKSTEEYGPKPERAHGNGRGFSVIFFWQLLHCSQALHCMLLCLSEPPLEKLQEGYLVIKLSQQGVIGCQ